MSKLAHSNQPTMDEIERKHAEREGFEAEAMHDTRQAIRIGKQQRAMFDGIFNAFGSAKQEALRRQKVCVNACAGIRTEALEAGVVAEMVAVINALKASRSIIDTYEAKNKAVELFAKLGGAS